MTAPLDQVTLEQECLVQRCEKQGCDIDLADAPRPFKLADLDHPASPARGRRCDYLFISTTADGTGIDLYVIPVELKSSGFRATSVSKQLEGGAKAADRVVPKLRCRFVPVVAHRQAHRGQIAELAKQTVLFRGTHYAIKAIRCGEPLALAIDS